jgi:hypothetical protein
MGCVIPVEVLFLIGWIDGYWISEIVYWWVEPLKVSDSLFKEKDM